MGYDLNRFIGDVDDEFKCPICCLVLECAVQSPDCEHTFCSSCINEWIARQPICPVDRLPLRTVDLKPAPRVLRNFLAKLDIRCDFASSGCTAVVRLELLSSHCNECEFNPFKQIPCAKGCGLVLLRNQVDGHNCLSDLRELITGQQKQISELKNNRKVLSDEISELKSTVRRIQEEHLAEQGHKLTQLQSQMSAMQNTIDQLSSRLDQQDSSMVALDCSNYRSSCPYSSAGASTTLMASGSSTSSYGRKRTFPSPYQSAAKRIASTAASTPPHRFNSQTSLIASSSQTTSSSNTANNTGNDSDSEQDDDGDASPLSIPPMSPCSPLSLTTNSAAHHHHYYHCSGGVDHANRLVITFYGTVITLSGISTNDTVGSVKEKIEDKEQIPADEQLLFFAGQQLEDDRPLAYYSVPRYPHHPHSHSESGISRHLILRLRDGMKIYVKTLSDKVIEVQADPNDLIEIIKVKIHEQEGISPCDQRLLLDGHDLADLRTLSDYGIQHKSTLQLDLHLGGPCPICQSQFRSTGTSTGGEIGVVVPSVALAYKGKGKGKGKGERSCSGKAVLSSASVATNTAQTGHPQSPAGRNSPPSAPPTPSARSHTHSSGKRDRDTDTTRDDDIAPES